MGQTEKDVTVLQARDRVGFHAEVARCTEFGIRPEERRGRHLGAGQRYREEVDVAVLLRNQDATMHLSVVALEGDEGTELVLDVEFNPPEDVRRQDQAGEGPGGARLVTAIARLVASAPYETVNQESIERDMMVY